MGYPRIEPSFSLWPIKLGHYRLVSSAATLRPGGQNLMLGILRQTSARGGFRTLIRHAKGKHQN
jgi:hypothetical protein